MMVVVIDGVENSNVLCVYGDLSLVFVDSVE